MAEAGQAAGGHGRLVICLAVVAVLAATVPAVMWLARDPDRECFDRIEVGMTEDVAARMIQEVGLRLAEQMVWGHGFAVLRNAHL